MTLNTRNPAAAVFRVMLLGDLNMVTDQALNERSEIIILGYADTAVPEDFEEGEDLLMPASPSLCNQPGHRTSGLSSIQNGSTTDGIAVFINGSTVVLTYNCIAVILPLETLTAARFSCNKTCLGSG